MRLTKKIFTDLAIFMLGFGFSIGIVFPFFVTMLGVPGQYALTFPFFLACVSAGLIAGGVNYFLAHKIVGERLQILSDVGVHMRNLAETMRMNTDNTDVSKITKILTNEKLCGDSGCYIEVDSDDEFGDSAQAFNLLAQVLSQTVITERAAHSFSNLLATQLDLAILSEKAIEQLLLYTGSVGGLLAVVEQGDLQVSYSHLIKNTDDVLKSDYVIEAFKHGKTQIINMPGKEHIILDHVIGLHQTKFVIVDPITYKGVSLGVIILASQKEYSEEIVHRLQILGVGLGLALNNSLTHSRMRLLATLDPLTRLYNRGFGVKRLHEEYTRAVRSENPLGVIIFDIDDFKNVNDTYGHMVGDRVLINVAKAARNMLREGDILARYGGEEFMAVLPGGSLVDVGQVSERIRRAVNDLTLIEGDHAIKVTVSLGGASHPELNVSHEDTLIRHADAALYFAKESGKNRTHLDPTS